MTAPARRLRGLDAIQDTAAAIEVSRGIHWLPFDKIPRGGFSTREVSSFWALPYRRILAEIHDGRIEVITGSRDFVIPVDQLAVIRSWAVRLDPTA